MMRTWNTLAAAALLAALFPPAVPAGETPGKSDSKELLKKIEGLKTTVNALSAKVDGLAKIATTKEVLADLKRIEKAVLDQIDKVSRDLSQDIAAIKGEQVKQKIELQNLNGKLKAFEDELQLLSDKLMKVRKQLATETQAVPTLPAADKNGLDEILRRLAVIEKSVAALSSKERVAFSPPIGAVAKIVLRNEYPTLALFTVNGQKYRLVPGQIIEIPDVPAGDVTYEAVFDGYGPRPVRITTIGPNQTLTLTAR